MSFLEIIYWYCTDFCINSSNLLGISYQEFNFWLFIVIYPLITIVLIILNLIKIFKNKNQFTSLK